MRSTHQNRDQDDSNFSRNVSGSREESGGIYMEILFLFTLPNSKKKCRHFVATAVASCKGY